MNISATPIDPINDWLGRKVGLAISAIDEQCVFLYHKTTYREPYERMLAAQPEYQDLILWNSAQQVTESCVGNVVIATGDGLFTPPVSCGLLPGVFRRELIRQSQVQEASISVAQLRRAERLYLVNSVRGWLTLSKYADQDTWQVTDCTNDIGAVQ